MSGVQQSILATRARSKSAGDLGGVGAMDKSLLPTYYLSIMASERKQRRIERILDQIEQEADQQNWQRVPDLSTEILRFAPDNEAAAADSATGTKRRLF